MNFRINARGKARISFIAVLLVGLAGGVLISHFMVHNESPGHGQAGEDHADRQVLYWVAPMDPDYRRDEPGKSPMGMDLVPVYENEHRSDVDDNQAVYIDPVVASNLGVRTSKADRRSLWRKVEATAYVNFDESHVSQVNMRTEGWIQRLLVSSHGERVKQGQLLFEFYSPHLVNAQKEYVQAKLGDRASLISASAKKLKALGMTGPDIQRLDQSGKVLETIQVLAPQDGIITQLHVKEGMFIKPATEVMGLADLSSVWLQAGVFEAQAEWVIPGQSAEARLNYMPGEVFSGRVDYVYPVLDPLTRTLQVRLRFDNPGERMKPNMYARVTIFGKSHPGALSIPKEALLRGEHYDRVVVSLGDGTYVVREVVSGIESGEWVEIKSGIEVGDEVVTSAQFLIDSEASMAGSIQRLDTSGVGGQASGNRAVFGSGTVEAVDTRARKIRVSHGPIEDLGWSAMTMEFDVLSGTDLGAIGIGQNIRFSLHPSEVGDYEISIIQPTGTPQ